VNVLSLAELKLLTPELVSDFPLGAPRYVQRAEGYGYTLVNGRILTEGGELTGKLPGRVVTAGR
jgi:N-acyl-D-amino-acid deacylase